MATHASSIDQTFKIQILLRDICVSFVLFFLFVSFSCFVWFSLVTLLQKQRNNRKRHLPLKLRIWKSKEKRGHACFAFSTTDDDDDVLLLLLLRCSSWQLLPWISGLNSLIAVILLTFFVEWMEVSERTSEWVSWTLSISCQSLRISACC